MSNAESLTTPAPSSPLQVLQSTDARHVSILMGVPSPSTPPAGTAQGVSNEDKEESHGLVINIPTVGMSAAGRVAAPAPATSTPLVQEQITQDKRDPVASAVGGSGDITRYTEFWNAYNELADKEDKEIVKGYGSDLDTLLIFAGLFSATNTAFIIESYKDLKEDQAETTNKLLRSLILSIQQSSSLTESDLHQPRFTATKQSTVTNLFFFTSLFCSLLAAFGAVIGKQWLNNYEKEGQLRSPADKGLERHKKYLGLEDWHFQGVIETLPTLLQISLLSFLMGLVQFLWTFNLPVAILALIFTIITSGFWLIFLVIGASQPSAPFQTRLSLVLQNRWPFRYLNRGTDARDKTGDESIRGRCVDWLRNRSTAPATIGIIAKAVTMLSETARKAIKIEGVGAAIGYLLQSRYENHMVHLGVTSDMLQSSLIPLRDISRNWDKKRDLVHPEAIGNTQFVQALRHELWGLLLNKENPDPALKEAVLQLLTRIWDNDMDTGSDACAWGGRCVAWLKHYHGELEKILSVADSILQGSSLKDVPKCGPPLAVLLHSTIQDGVVSLGVSDKSLQVLVPILMELVAVWNRDSDLVHQEDCQNRSFLRALMKKLSSVVVNTRWEKESGAIILKLLERPELGEDEEGLQPIIDAWNGHLPVDLIDHMDRLHLFSVIYRKLIALKLDPRDDIQCHDDVCQLLLSTMWSSDDMPELECADVRVRWILDNFDVIYPRIPPNYDKYLERWLHNTQTRDHNILFIRSFGRLLPMDPKGWSRNLENLELNIPASTVKYMLSNATSDTDHLRCLTSFLLKGVSKPVQSTGISSYGERINYYDLFLKNEQGTFSEANDRSGLFKTMLRVVDSPTEGVLAASGFWRFLVAAHRDGQILKDWMRLERDSIAGYLMDRPITTHWPSESAIDLRFQNLPKRYTEDRYPAINDINRSCFILSLPKIQQDIRDLATEVSSRAISNLHSAYLSDTLEHILGSIGKISRGPSDALMEVLEKENYVETIARYIGVSGDDGEKKQPRDVRWWCLRLFLLMWGRRFQANSTPYASDYCFQQLNDFFSSMKNQVEVDVVESKRSLDELPITNLPPFQFLDSACSYFEFVSAQRGLPINDAVALGFLETCRHVGVSGASQLPEYQGDGGGDRWEQDTAPLVERIGGLRDKPTGLHTSSSSGIFGKGKSSSVGSNPGESSVV